MRRKDARHLLILIACGLLLGANTAPDGAAARAVAARSVFVAAVFLLIGSLAICVRIYRQDRASRRKGES
jgi:hypothetical protein